MPNVWHILWTPQDKVIYTASSTPDANGNLDQTESHVFNKMSFRENSFLTTSSDSGASLPAHNSVL